MLTGIFSTLLLPETKNRTLEELSNEEQEGFVRGEWTFCRVPDSLVDILSTGPSGMART